MFDAQPCPAVRLRCLLGLLLLVAAPVFGQGINGTSSGCELVTSQLSGGNRSGFVPVISGRFADTVLESQLAAAYQTLSLPTKSQPLRDSLQATLTLARSRSNRCAEALATYGLGIFFRSADLSASSDWFRQAESGFRESGSASGLAHVHFELAAGSQSDRSADEAAASFASAADELERIGDPLDALSARMQAVNLSGPNVAEQLDELASRARALHSASLEARIHQLWGDSLFTKGQYDQAMLHYRRSDELYISCRCDPDQRAYVQTSMGRLERTHGRPEAAIPHYRLALSLQNLAHDPSFVPQTLNAISVAYETMHQYQRAIAYVQQALAVARAIHSQQFIDFLEANLGFLYYQSGDPRRGLQLLKRATANLNNDYQRCTRYAQLAELYVALSDLSQAETTITHSIDACERDHNNRNLADSLETRARIRLAANNGSLDAALADAQRSLAIIEEIRSHVVPEDAHKRGYNEASIQSYETTIAILARLNRYPEALEVTEQSRGRAFLDLLSGPHAPLSAAISFVSTSTESTSNHNRSSSSPAGLLLESESHVQAMQTSEILATAARLHTTILAFWISSEPSPRLYSWVIRPDATPSSPAIFGTSQAIRLSELESLIHTTNPSFSRARGGPASGAHSAAQSPSDLHAWRRLYQILITPIASHLPTEPGALVTIVPHGPLFQLSFAALLDSRNRYLVERYAINSIPAAGLLRYTQKNEAAADELTPHYVLVANPRNLPQFHGVPLPPLPGTAAEVAAIAKTVTPEEVTLLEGQRAGAEELIQVIPQATVLHFATHAIVSGTDPFGSFLALNRSSEDKASPENPAPDGLLTTASIYSLHLHTRMVVLSACRTGLGPVSADGVAGLSRAFFYAGSASVLTTLWDVADQPTAVLMPLFYQNLAHGQSRALALRSAQLELITRLRTGRLRVPVGNSLQPLPERPAYWAAFSLSGQP
jgi:CHAT domain-containing protein/tetratricopeptide (TPR) repeat protein